MKRLITILALATVAVLAASPLMAAGVPGTINYQGRLTDGAGSNVADGVYTLTFKIYDAPAGGSLLWNETKPVQVTNGLLTTQLGTGTAIPANLFSGGADRYLGVTVNLDPEMPRVLLNSVAYAYQAKDADVATLAQDLTCVGCVSAGEIAANAVGSAEIASDAVTSAEIAASAVGSSEIANDAVGASEIIAGAVGTSEVADGSLTAVDIDDEPGVASNTEGTTTIVLDGTVQTLLSRAITTPAAGYVFVIATAQMVITHTNGTGSVANFGVSTTAGVFPANQDVGVQISTAIPTGVYVLPVTVHGLFSTPGGSDTFYFLGDESGGNFSVSDMQLTLIYFPTAYGTVVSTPAASGGEIISYQSAETGSVLQERGSDPVQTEVASPASFQQELAQVKTEMEARIQKLEEQLRQNQQGAEEKK